MAVLPGGARFVSGSRDKTAKLFTFGGELERTFEVGSDVWCVAALPDGVHFVVGLGTNNRRSGCTTSTGRASTRAQGDDTSMVNAVAVTPDGQHIISGSR